MPPTTPLPASITNKIKSRDQAVKWFTQLKEVRYFSAYCCDIDSDGIMGVAKEPVARVDIGPNPVCLGESIDWDLRDSYAPGSTISAWEIDFGDGEDDSGANITTAFGSHTYAAIGSYTVTITIEEGLGKSQEVTREINVVDCTEPPVTWAYVATDGQGVYFRELPDGAWTAKNKGLSGDDLFIRSLVMKPGSQFKNVNSQEIWIATLGGVFKTTNGGDSWDKIDFPEPSNNEFLDPNPVSLDELDWHHIVFDPIDEDTIYIVASREE